jgi:hypothetical protein
MNDNGSLSTRELLIGVVLAAPLLLVLVLLMTR